MQRKLIAIDLDGTTLNRQSQISDRTKQVLQQAVAAGHIVSIVTGRPYRISKQYYDQLGLKSAMINFNGSLGHLPHQEWAKEYQYTIDRDVALDLLAHQQALGIETIAAENKNHVWANHGSDGTIDFFPTVVAHDQLLNSDNLTSDPTALTVYFDESHRDQLIGDLTKRYGDHLDMNVWGGSWPVLELAHKGIEKATGVDFLAKTYQIDRSDIIAFGDEGNDRAMIDYAGWGVVMQNGIDSLKQMGQDVTALDNDHNGLAEYLSDYLELPQALAKAE
ncbi:Cof-type HAD-IIB family hydrolase [Furfurilactobacillus siliginis]|uniref:Cof-like hydrolase n=1 Tax=Furfurilactobacillus siliginis TaxID=348151 RepID=A0A0R2L5E8_9LACO|nr:Cof-type HAD-IIB family hydrolase [Furfurilactobacillus siliginis]KRN96943.1 Cof-like hydrolase [Furfurilactobacillus siliginis]GEK27702.1 haloacid dehalogenase [Furfurilactobacillus siliginis]